MLNSGQYGAFTEGGKIVSASEIRLIVIAKCLLLGYEVPHMFTAGLLPVLQCGWAAGIKESRRESSINCAYKSTLTLAAGIWRRADHARTRWT